EVRVACGVDGDAGIVAGRGAAHASGLDDVLLPRHARVAGDGHDGLVAAGRGQVEDAVLVGLEVAVEAAAVRLVDGDDAAREGEAAVQRARDAAERRAVPAVVDHVGVAHGHRRRALGLAGAHGLVVVRGDAARGGVVEPRRALVVAERQVAARDVEVVEEDAPRVLVDPQHGVQRAREVRGGRRQRPRAAVVGGAEHVVGRHDEDRPLARDAQRGLGARVLHVAEEPRRVGALREGHRLAGPVVGVEPVRGGGLHDGARHRRGHGLEAARQEEGDEEEQRGAHARSRPAGAFHVCGGNAALACVKTPLTRLEHPPWPSPGRMTRTILALLTTSILLAALAPLSQSAALPALDDAGRFVLPEGATLRLHADTKIVAPQGIRIDGTILGERTLDGRGASLVLETPGDVTLRGSIVLADGADGVAGQRGGDGGGLVVVSRSVRLEPGSLVALGAGGHGGDVRTEDPLSVARGGDGGRGGPLVLQATEAFLDGMVLLGRGGDGGRADAVLAAVGGSGGPSSVLVAPRGHTAIAGGACADETCLGLSTLLACGADADCAGREVCLPSCEGLSIPCLQVACAAPLDARPSVHAPLPGQPASPAIVATCGGNGAGATTSAAPSPSGLPGSNGAAPGDPGTSGTGGFPGISTTA